MTYKVEETQFWGGNLGYAKPVVKSSLGDGNVAAIAETHVYSNAYSYKKEVHAGSKDSCIICSGPAKPLVEADIVNTAGAKIDKDVREGLISGEAVKFDQGKRDWSLLPYDSIEEIAKVLEFGKIKYAAWNWTEGGGFKYTRVFNASMRHLLAFMRGEDKDPDSGLSHIAHLGCNVLFLLHFILNKEKYNTCDDRRVP